MVQVVITMDDNGQVSLQSNGNRFQIYGMMMSTIEALILQQAREGERLVQLAPPGAVITGKN